MVLLIARRELREIVRDPNLLVPLLLLPCLVGMAAGLTAFVSARSSDQMGQAVTTAVLDQLPAAAQRRLAATQAEAEQQAPPGAERSGPPPATVQRLTIGTLLKALSLPLFWIVAAALTPALAADSFVGEKERGTIEPLLATPIRDQELFGGKLLGAIIPAILGTWLGTGLYALLAALSRSPYYPPFLLADRDWIFSSLVLAPLTAILAASAGALISTRVSSYRVAYQLNSLLVLPVVLVLVPQAVLLFLLTPMAFVYVAGLLAVADLLLIAWAVRLFDRERLLAGR
jgi:ABC-type Na+ efflux pump permease subunit